MAKLPPLPPEQQNIKIDLSLATDVRCDNCGNYTFERAVLLKHLSELVSPTHEAAFVPIGVFQCASCGHVNEAFLPQELRTKPATSAVSEPTKTTLEIIK